MVLVRGAVTVAAVALLIGAVLRPHEILPKAGEPLERYLQRLASDSSQVVEDIYVRALLALPGVQVTVVESKTSQHSDVPQKQRMTSAEANLLKQEVAHNEDEINLQQKVSAMRYAEAETESTELILPEEPDEVRHSMPPLRRRGPEMRCGEAIPAFSSLTTRSIELKAKSIFQGKHGSQYSWKYEITFINHGSETVQMLSRHWVFVDSFGGLEVEVKGPGARGVTPVLPPGGTWSYESGTTLKTAHGSMHGSFQFEILKTAAHERSFSARVARLALLSEGKSKSVPCIDEAKEEMLPATSVMSTERVIIGATGHFLKKVKEQYRFHYDVQINNARAKPIEVIGHFWEVVDPTGRRVVDEGPGVGGSYQSRNYSLPAGEAFRTAGVLLSTSKEVNVQGTYRVKIQGAGKESEIEARTDFMGISAVPGVTHVANFVADPNLR